MNSDIFKKIPCLYDLYEVNEDGTMIRCVDPKRKDGHFLKPYKNKGGTLCITLSNLGFKNHPKVKQRNCGAWTSYQVNYRMVELVADAFLGPQPSVTKINFIDGDRLNIHHTNLEYVPIISEENARKEFRLIPCLYNLYEINEDGTVIRRISDGVVRKASISKVGYLRITFYDEEFENHPKQSIFYRDGCIQYNVTYNVHQLVADAFLVPKEKDLIIDHIDRNKLNNHYTNLRYVTYSMNTHNTSDENKEKWVFPNINMKATVAMDAIEIESGRCVTFLSIADFAKEVFFNFTARHKSKSWKCISENIMKQYKTKRELYGFKIENIGVTNYAVDRCQETKEFFTDPWLVFDK